MGSDVPAAIHQPRPHILIVDDVAMVRERVRDLLCRHGYVAIAAASGEEAINIARESGRIALALLDILMPDARIEGIEAARVLTGTYRVRCLMLTSKQEAASRAAAMLAGALGYLVKDNTTGDTAIVTAVRAALDGQPLPEPLSGGGLTPAEMVCIHQREVALNDAYARLTVRQREIADLAAEGLTNEQIALRLGIGESTVTSHVRAVLARLELAGRRELRPRVIYDSLLD
jgi:DNA-binding NarL/FixJ family response regulator